MANLRSSAFTEKTGKCLTRVGDKIGKHINTTESGIKLGVPRGMSRTTKDTKGMRIIIGVPGNNNTFENDLRYVVVICEASYKSICGVSIYICGESYKYSYGGSNIYICGVNSTDICGVNNKFNSGGGRAIALSSADKTLISGVETIYINIGGVEGQTRGEDERTFHWSRDHHRCGCYQCYYILSRIQSAVCYILSTQAIFIFFGRLYGLTVIFFFQFSYQPTISANPPIHSTFHGTGLNVPVLKRLISIIQPCPRYKVKCPCVGHTHQPLIIQPSPVINQLFNGSSVSISSG